MKKVPLRRHIVWSIFLFFLGMVSFFCAGQVPPSGGPADKVPPEIIVSYPTLRSLNFHDKRISFSFSKYVSKRSLEESIFISPSLGDLTFDWGGADVEVHFSDSLRPNTTYVITVGTDVVDTRPAPNRMSKAYALPFSTGDHIDSASISGKVYGEKPEGIMVFSYRLTGRNPDTLNPIHTRPDYLTQTGKGGTFVLPYLALGRYRLIAVRDEFKNLVYDRETDLYGVPSRDIDLNDTLSSVSDVHFQMAREDTTPPFLSSARALDRSRVLVRFSELVDTSGMSAGSVSIIDTLNGRTLLIYDLSFAGGSSIEVQVTTAAQESTAVYRLTMTGVRDSRGNPMRSVGNSGLFTGGVLPDTSRPFLLLTSIADSARRVAIEDTLRFFFSKPVVKEKLEKGFRVLDSSASVVPGKFLWSGSAAVSFLPVSPFLKNAVYMVKIILDSLQDLSGNRVRDSVRVLSFHTVDEKIFGTISGTVFDELVNGGGRIYLDLTEVAKKGGRSRRAILEQPGQFEITGVPEGKYSLFAFRDTDGNGSYNPGTVFPFSPSERFVAYPDTLKVRARWAVEGVTIRFKP